MNDQAAAPPLVRSTSDRIATLTLSPTDLSRAWGGYDDADPRLFQWLQDLPSDAVPDRYRFGPASLPYEPFDQPLRR